MKEEEVAVPPSWMPANRLTSRIMKLYLPPLWECFLPSMSHVVRITRRCAALTPHWRKRYLHKHVQVKHAQGQRLHVHTPQVLGCTPPTIIHHFSFQSAPCHDIQRFTSHTRTKSHIEVYPLSTQSMLTTTATRWCPIGIVIHGYRRCQINGTSIFRQLIRFHPHRIKTLRLSKVLIHIKTRRFRL